MCDEAVPSVQAVNVPVPLLAGVIVPPGALSVPVSVSVTVHVQVVESFTGIDPDAQLTPVVVVRGRTVSAKALAAQDHTSELPSRPHVVGRLLLEKKNT